MQLALPNTASVGPENWEEPPEKPLRSPIIRCTLPVCRTLLRGRGETNETFCRVRPSGGVRCIGNLPVHRLLRALRRLTATTHGFDQGQRYIRCDFSQVGNSLTVTPPADGGVAPPGCYMLFAVDQYGAPSYARYTKVGP
jgi:hypothetical protein